MSKTKSEKAATRLSFFDLVGAINLKTPVEWTDEVDAAYNSFMVNRAFSQYPDTVWFADLLNQYPNLDKRLCFDLLYTQVPKKKRFGAWAKAEKQTADEQLLSDFLGISSEKTKSYILTLDVVFPEWREKLQEQTEQGGRRK